MTCACAATREVTRGRLKQNISREMAVVNTRELSTGDMHGRWQSGSAVRVETGKKARDGHIRLFLSADWEGAELTPPPFRASGRKIPVSAHILDAMGLLQCTAVLMLCGAQTGPWHLNIVAHIKDWLFSITPITVTRRDVEGAGIVEYINVIWCSDTRLALYERTSRAYGIHAYPCGETEWDAHWYIYRRGIETPSYAHVGAARRDTCTPRDPAATPSPPERLPKRVRAARRPRPECDAGHADARCRRRQIRHRAVRAFGERRGRRGGRGRAGAEPQQEAVVVFGEAIEVVK